MKIAVLGKGVEGNAVAEYFKNDEITFFEKFTDEELDSFGLENFDLVFRSPSVHPLYLAKQKSPHLIDNWTTITNYFFSHVKAPIIGVTGTKGKGTTCSIIASILREFSEKFEHVHLVGNIGNPAILELDQITERDIVVYEMSSFQCWDLEKSPHISVVLRIEPDHLDRHPDFDDYVDAKSHIVLNQTAEDSCIYYANNLYSETIGELSKGQKFSYPIKSHLEELNTLLDQLQIPGEHNRENAEAAILAVLALFNVSYDKLFLPENRELYQKIADGLHKFQGLPHRLQFVRELNHVRYYDDNYSSAFPAADVAIAAFENYPTFLIAGGFDRGLDLTKMKQRFFSAKNLKKIILIGETKTRLAEGEDPEKYCFAETLEEAVNIARKLAEAQTELVASNYDLCLPISKNCPKEAIVLMSPGAASFDMFKNFSDRGEQFQALVKSLK